MSFSKTNPLKYKNFQWNPIKWLISERLSMDHLSYNMQGLILKNKRKMLSFSPKHLLTNVCLTHKEVLEAGDTLLQPAKYNFFNSWEIIKML